MPQNMTCNFEVGGLMYITAESNEFNAIKKFGLQVEPLLLCEVKHMYRPI